MTPEQLAAIERARSRLNASPSTALTPEQQAVIDRYQSEQSDKALAAMDPPRVPEGMVLNPQTGQMEDLRSPINPNFQGEGMGTSAMAGGGQGVSLGFMDEAVGNLYGGIQAARGQGGFAENRDYGTAVQRERLRQARERDPVTAYGSEVVGGALPAVAGGVAATGGRLAGRGAAANIARGAGVGAAEGAAYGFGAGEGGLEERLPDAAMGGVVGGAVGGVAAPVIGGLTAVGRGVSNPIMAALNAGNKGRAVRTMDRTMSRAGVSPDDLRRYLDDAAADGQPEFMAGDALGIEGQRALSGIARSPDEGRAAITRALDTRQAGAPDRMSTFLADALGSSDTAASRRAAMEAQRSATADTLYGASRADAAPVDVRGAVQAVDEFITPYQGSGVTPPPLVTQLQGIRNRMSAPNPPGGATSVELSDYDSLLRLKREVESLASQQARSGDNFAASEIGKIKRELDAALEQASEGYRAANDTFRADSAAIDQLDAGRAAAAPRVRPEDTISQYQALPQQGPQVPAQPGQVPMEPREAFRIGYGDPLFAKIDNSGPNANPSTPFTRPKSVAEMDALAIDPTLFQRRVGREQVMGETRRQATGGSLTANNLADSADMDGAALGTAVDAGRDALNLNFGNILARGARAMQGQNEGTRKILTEMLTSNNPRAILEQMEPSQNRDAVLRSILEALTRTSAGRPAIEAAR